MERNRQIFVGASRRRRRVFRYAALAVGLACVGYLLMLAAAFSSSLEEHGAGKLPRTAEPTTPGTGW